MLDHRPIGIASARERRASCSASDLLRWCGMPAWVDLQTDHQHFALRPVPAQAALVVQGQTLLHLHVVVAGSFKIARIDDDGYEQVLGFAWQGDVLGLDAMPTQRHASGVVALEDSAVALLPLLDPTRADGRAPAIEAMLWRAAGLELCRRADTQYQMSAPSTEVRLARFLIGLGQRQRQMGHSDRLLNLRMSRRDIASCLGVAHESVSRALAALVEAGCISVHLRDVEILDAQALQALQRITRGAPRSQALRHAQAHAEAQTPMAA